jgi:hypothetical protein
LIAGVVDCAVQVLPIASNLDVNLIHPPAGVKWALATLEIQRLDPQNFQDPSMHVEMINNDVPRLHHFLPLVNAQRVGCIPPSAN